MKKINIDDLKGKTYKECLEAGVKIEYSVPIMAEKESIESVADQLLYEDEDGLLTYDPILKDIMVANAITILYTNIELSDKPFDDYDILNECGLLEQYEWANDGKCTEFDGKLNCVLTQRLTTNDVNHIVARALKSMIKTFDNTMNHVNGMLDKGDPNKIAKYLSKGIEMIANKMPDFSKVDVMESLQEQINKNKLS